ncbi:MAG: hypothetical protein ABIQ78_12080 [Dokdonella sp.]
MDSKFKLRKDDANSVNHVAPVVAIALTLIMPILVGCVAVKPQHVMLHGQTYIQGAATKAGPLAGLPDMGPHQLVLLTAQSEREQTQHIPVWGCSAFDFGTTAIGLAAGLAEANPLGILIVPIVFMVNHSASRRAKNGDTGAAKISSVAHCGAGVANLMSLL